MGESSRDGTARRQRLRRASGWVSAVAVLAGLIATSAALAGDSFLGSAGALDYYSDVTPAISAPGTANQTVGCGGRIVGGGILPSGATTESYVAHTGGTAGSDGSGPAGSWYGKFVNISGSSKSATVFAICASRKAKTIRAGGAAVKSGASRKIKANCPAGTHVSGGGGQINGYGGVLVRMVSSYPFDDKDPGHAPDDGWAVRFYNGSNEKQRFLDAVAHCLNADGVLSYLTSVTGQRFCPDADHVAGGGIKQEQADPSYAWINASAPFDAGDGDSAPDDGWRAVGRDVSTSKTGYAICMG
jgi:hypothetical protein